MVLFPMPFGPYLIFSADLRSVDLRARNAVAIRDGNPEVVMLGLGVAVRRSSGWCHDAPDFASEDQRVNALANVPANFAAARD
jgi:hypothetical protein